MTHRATMSFAMGDAEVAASVAGAMAVEAKQGPDGSRAVVRQDGLSIHVQLEAEAVAELRAALNSLVRLLDAAARAASL